MFKSQRFTAVLILASALGTLAAFADGPATKDAALAATSQPAAATSEWLENEVHASYSAKTRRAIVDVNDEFILSSAPNNEAMVLQLGVLDGTRARYGECGSGRKPELGQTQTTWLSLKYSKPDQNGERKVSLTRTLDFYGHQRTYSFISKGGWERAVLEPGVTVEIKRGVLHYSQMKGPLGTSGNTKSLDFAHELSMQPGVIRSAVAMNSSTWSITTNGSQFEPVYNVNGHPIVAFLPESQTSSGASSRLIVPPVRFDMSSKLGSLNKPASLLERVEFQKENPDTDPREITGVETDDAAAPIPCPAVKCRDSLDCFAGLGSYCTCAYVISGGGVCLI